MSGGLDKARERLAEHLRAQGLTAVTAWGQEGRKERAGAVVCVSLRGCRTGPSGFRDYLGERYDPVTGRWEELYGKRAKLIFGLDLYADAQAGEGAIQTAFDRMTDALSAGGPEELTVEEISCGETQYDREGRTLKRTVEAVCGAYLYAVAEPGGTFLDFEIRGGRRV